MSPDTLISRGKPSNLHMVQTVYNLQRISKARVRTCIQHICNGDDVRTAFNPTRGTVRLNCSGVMENGSLFQKGFWNTRLALTFVHC